MFKEKFQLEESVEGSNTPVQKLALVSTQYIIVGTYLLQF